MQSDRNTFQNHSSKEADIYYDKALDLSKTAEFYRKKTTDLIKQNKNNEAVIELLKSLLYFKKSIHAINKYNKLIVGSDEEMLDYKSLLEKEVLQIENILTSFSYPINTINEIRNGINIMEKKLIDTVDKDIKENDFDPFELYCIYYLFITSKISQLDDAPYDYEYTIYELKNKNWFYHIVINILENGISAENRWLIPVFMESITTSEALSSLETKYLDMDTKFSIIHQLSQYVEKYKLTNNIEEFRNFFYGTLILSMKVIPEEGDIWDIDFKGFWDPLNKLSETYFLLHLRNFENFALSFYCNQNRNENLHFWPNVNQLLDINKNEVLAKCVDEPKREIINVLNQGLRDHNSFFSSNNWSRERKKQGINQVLEFVFEQPVSYSALKK